MLSWPGSTHFWNTCGLRDHVTAMRSCPSVFPVFLIDCVFGCHQMQILQPKKQVNKTHKSIISFFSFILIYSICHLFALNCSCCSVVVIMTHDLVLLVYLTVNNFGFLDYRTSYFVLYWTVMTLKHIRVEVVMSAGDTDIVWFCTIHSETLSSLSHSLISSELHSGGQVVLDWHETKANSVQLKVFQSPRGRFIWSSEGGLKRSLGMSDSTEQSLLSPLSSVKLYWMIPWIDYNYYSHFIFPGRGDEGQVNIVVLTGRFWVCLETRAFWSVVCGDTKDVGSIPEPCSPHVGVSDACDAASDWTSKCPQCIHEHMF